MLCSSYFHWSLYQLGLHSIVVINRIIIQFISRFNHTYNLYWFTYHLFTIICLSKFVSTLSSNITVSILNFYSYYYYCLNHHLHSFRRYVNSEEVDLIILPFHLFIQHYTNAHSLTEWIAQRIVQFLRTKTFLWWERV